MLLHLFLTFAIYIFGWSCVPVYMSDNLAYVDLGKLYFLGTTFLGVFTFLGREWQSEAHSMCLVALHSVNQGTSYELVLGFILCALAGIGGSFILADISYSQSNVFFVFYFFFFVAGLTKTNRQPFNLAEAEFELFLVQYKTCIRAVFT
jgi:NADH-quinone oxidoreductase subunit H